MLSNLWVKIVGKYYIFEFLYFQAGLIAYIEMKIFVDITMCFDSEEMNQTILGLCSSKC